MKRNFAIYLSFLLIGLFTAAILVACGGNGTYSPTVQVSTGPTPVAISVSPGSASTVPGGTVQFTATVTGTANTGVTWSVVTTGGGTITSTGLYTAPSPAVSSAHAKDARLNAIYTIQAVSQADPTKSATATVTVKSTPLSITITPAPGVTYPTGTIQFHATVTGTSNQSVTWSVVTPSGGTISSTGLYTAPPDNFVAGRNPRLTRTYTIKAVSSADSNLSTTALAQVSDVVVAVTPQNMTVLEGQTIQFSATVTGPTTNHGVKWYGNDGGGTIDINTGLFTAGNVPGTYQVYAESDAQNGIAGYADLIVTAPASGVAVKQRRK